MYADDTILYLGGTKTVLVGPRGKVLWSVFVELNGFELERD